MNWQQFIIRLLDHDLRLSSLEVEKLTSIRQQIVDRWKRGGVEKPHRNTIRRLEQGLGIQIHDTDPENITYSRITGADAVPSPENSLTVTEFNSHNHFSEITIPLQAAVPAGTGQIQDRTDSVVVSLDSRNQFAVLIDPNNGESMQPFLQPGDIVICDMHAPVKTGDIVAARWSGSRGAIKIVGDSGHAPESYLLYSYNPVIKPIIVPKSTTRLYKVIYIKKSAH